jgi:hypothetical protein
MSVLQTLLKFWRYDEHDKRQFFIISRTSLICFHMSLTTSLRRVRSRGKMTPL